MRSVLASSALALALLARAPSASAAEKPKPRVVLVEADGPEEELSAFVARLESELSDGGKLALSDARLSGATLGTLAAQPGGEGARVFRAEWPGETWIAVSLAPCSVEVRRISYRDPRPEAYGAERVVENVHVACPATLRLVDAATGKERKPIAVTGMANYRRDADGEEESSELEGVRDAAKRAAKKLPSSLKD